MKIIPAELSDLPTIGLIARQTWPAAYSSIISSEQIEYMLQLFYSTSALQRQMEEGHHFLLAIDEDNSAMGFADWQLKTPELAKLHKLYVLPGVQRKNIGKKLLEKVLSASRQATAKKLELNVNRKNSALEFYKKNGFEIDRSEDIDIGSGYFMNDYVMSIHL